MPCNNISIISNDRIAEKIYRMTLPFDNGGPISAGQFFMVKSSAGGTLLPRAVSVCDYSEGVLTFLYQVVGRGTSELAAMRPGGIMALTGPLGNGFAVEGLAGKIALVGGGIGIAPMLLTARMLKEKGSNVTVLCGFRDEAFLTDELSAVADRLDIATESGRTGAKGFVTQLLDPKEYAAVLCCGPMPMMRAVTALCTENNTPVFVSMENKMACGIGACLVCTCADKDGRNHRVCKDGPVFRGEEINFDS